MVIEMSIDESVRTATPRHRAPEHDVLRVDDETHMVFSDGEPAGFVWRAGDIFVALEGRDLGRACEVGQSLVWDVAVGMVERAHRAA